MLCSDWLAVCAANKNHQHGVAGIVRHRVPATNQSEMKRRNLFIYTSGFETCISPSTYEHCNSAHRAGRKTHLKSRHFGVILKI